MQDALIIGSRLDADAGTAACRLAFSGRLVTLLDADDQKALAALRVFKPKQRCVKTLPECPDFSVIRSTSIRLLATCAWRCLHSWIGF